MSSRKEQLGGIIHTYQKFDPVKFPSPTAPPPDLVSPAFEHLLHYGSMRRLTDEELARAVHLDPSQIAGLGPSIEALRMILEERKRKILETYETGRVEAEARQQFLDQANAMQPPGNLAKRFQQAFHDNADVHAAVAYEGIKLLHDAMVHCKESLSVQRVREELGKLKDSEGLCGSLSFTPEGQLSRTAFLVRLADSGTKVVKRWKKRLAFRHYDPSRRAPPQGSHVYKIRASRGCIATVGKRSSLLRSIRLLSVFEFNETITLI